MKFCKLVQPKINPFGLYIYYPEKGQLTFRNFQESIILSNNLDKLNEKATYCNSDKHIFISQDKHFWLINNNSFSVIKKEMPLAKAEHSMIFIPSIGTFIIGGGDKKTFYYDTKKNYFLNWAETNAVHKNPALIQIGDYLYIFGDIKKDGGCFERTKLTDKKKQWEKITPKFEKGENDRLKFVS